jgi:hypothetical protein
MDPGNRQNAPERRAPAWRPNPKGYVRSDERIFEDICEGLMRERDLDTRQLRVAVHEGVATLQGQAAGRRDRARVAQVAAAARGVRAVDNRLRVEGEPHEGDLDPALSHGLAARRRGARADRDALLATLADALRAHALVEGALLYPALEPHAPGDVRRAREEHRLVERLVGELRGEDVADDVWQARVEVLRAVVELHVRGEEAGLFLEVLRVITPERAADLYAQMLRMRALPAGAPEAPSATRVIDVVRDRDRAYHLAPCTPSDARGGP